MTDDTQNQSSVTVADYLGMQAARLINLKGTPPCAVITYRLNPSVSLTPSNIALTQEQCLRLRDDLNSLLTDPDSWLFMEKASMSPSQAELPTK